MIVELNLHVACINEPIELTSVCCSLSSFADRSHQLAGRNGVKPLHDPGNELLLKRLEAAEGIARQANEELLAAYRRAEAAEQEGASHQATKQDLKVMSRA